MKRDWRLATSLFLLLIHFASLLAFLDFFVWRETVCDYSGPAEKLVLCEQSLGELILGWIVFATFTGVSALLIWAYFRPHK